MKLSRILNKYKILVFILVFGFISLFVNTCYAQTVQYDEEDEPYSVTFPAGSFFRAVLQHKVATNINNVGDVIELIIPSDYMVGQVNCVPKSSRIVGKIVRLEKAKAGLNGYFQIIFTKLILPDDQKLDIIGHIWTKQGDGVIGGEFSERIGYRRVPHHLYDIGGVIQLVPDGPRKVGKETEILPGQEWVIVLDKELKINIIVE